MTDEPIKILAELLEASGAKLTLSKNCCSGIVHVLGPEINCECWRCREKRGEPHDEETEAYAATLSTLAYRKFRESKKQYWQAEDSDDGTMQVRSLE